MRKTREISGNPSETNFQFEDRDGNYFEKLPERNIYIETLHYRLQIQLKNDIMVKLYSPDKMVGIQN